MTKLFYKIGEVSKLAEVEPYILRYWESEFPMLAPRKNQGGQRVYQDKDLDMVLDIKRMLHEEGYTIAGARKKLAESGRGARVKAAGPGKSPADAAEHGRQSEEAAPPVKDAREPVAPPVKETGTPFQPDMLESKAAYRGAKDNAELADALGRFKDEIKGILDLLR